MFRHTKQLAYKVRVDEPNPVFAKYLQQAIGGVEGEIRVMMQYMFQAWGQRGPKKYRDMILATGTEEIGHIEMLATAVALNLEGAPLSLQEEKQADERLTQLAESELNPAAISAGQGAAEAANDKRGGKRSSAA